jgi:hypothetical protein
VGSIGARTGPNGTRKKLECLPVANGLVAHAATDVERKLSMLNITHKQSGLSILQHVPEWALPTAVVILGRADWDLPIEEIARNTKYFPLIGHAIREIRKMSLIHKESARQEDELARDLSGRRQPASGSRWGHRRDVITPELLVEAKTTTQKSYRINDKDMAFLCKQAYKKGRVPVYAIEIQQKPNVMVVPTSELDSECFDNTKRRSIDVRNKKSYAITAALADWLNDGGSMNIRLPSGFYTALGYEKFLELAKRGINA